jgi:sterol desaturase/sphingolipid hydroxylase (fatty acid hydroxylase superfamily)
LTGCFGTPLFFVVSTAVDLPAILAVQNWVLVGALAAAAVWESLAPYRGFPSGADRARHAGRNLALGTAMVVLTTILVGASGWQAMLWAQARGVGLLNLVALPWWIVVPVGFLLADFADYLFHRLSHTWRWVWMLHAVHHSDPHLDTTSTVRTHPLHAVAAIAWRVLVAFALGIPLAVILLRDVAATPLIALHHANLAWPERVDRALRWLVVTPAMHKLHHSPERAFTNANFGGLLSLWDRLLGTYREPGSSPAAYGLTRLAAPRDQSLWGMLVTPLRARRYPQL